MLAFHLFPPPHGTPMAGEGVPHTKCGTKRARRAAPETRAERSSLQCPPSAGGLRCGLRCAEVAAQNSPSRESLFCRDLCCGAVGSLSDTYRVSTENLSVACPTSVGRPSDAYQIQRCRNDKRFSRKGNTAKARRKDRNYNISAMPDPAALCATAK